LKTETLILWLLPGFIKRLIPYIFPTVIKKVTVISGFKNYMILFIKIRRGYVAYNNSGNEFIKSHIYYRWQGNIT